MARFTRATTSSPILDLVSFYVAVTEQPEKALVGNGLFGLRFQATVITEGNLMQELSRWLQHIHHHRRGGAACLLPSLISPLFHGSGPKD